MKRARPGRGSRQLLAAGLALLLSNGVSSLQPAAAAEVVVQEGDTLETIALRHGVTVDLLVRWNDLRNPDALQVGEVLYLPDDARNEAGRSAAATHPSAAAPPPDDAGALQAQAALLLSPGERRDRAELAQRELSGAVRWKWFDNTAVDWSGWRLHPGGVRITLVRPAASDVGARRSGATAIAVQCSRLRQTWRVDGQWEPWAAPAAGSVGLRIVLDLCSNTLDGPAVPVPPPT